MFTSADNDCNIQAPNGLYNLPFCTYLVTIHNLPISVQLALHCFQLRSQLLHLRGLVCDDSGLLSEHVLDIFDFLVDGADRDVGLANRRGGGGSLLGKEMRSILGLLRAITGEKFTYSNGGLRLDLGLRLLWSQRAADSRRRRLGRS